MLFAPNCRIAGIRTEGMLILDAIRQVDIEMGLVIYVTSITNGTHSRKSLHYIGHAVDFDVVPEPNVDDIDAIHNILSSALTLEYDVVCEYNADKSFSHFHIEFQPKTPLNDKV